MTIKPTILNTNQLGGNETVFTESSLRSSNNVDIKLKTNPYVIGDDTLACWHFDDSVIDFVNNITLTPPNSETASYCDVVDKFKFTKSLYLTNQGASSSERAFELSSPISLSNQWSIDFWMSASGANGYPSSNVMLRNNGVWGVEVGSIQIGLSDSKLRLPGYEAYDLTNIPEDGKMHHIAICIDTNGTVYQFIDGDLKPTVFAPNARSFQIAYIGTSGGYGTETMDELRISNKCLWTSSFDISTYPYATSSSDSYYVVEAKVDTTLSSSSTNPVQNRIINTALSGKQDTLVSGTNIKTINNSSILGSGNLAVESLPSQTGKAGKYLTTDGTNASWSDDTVFTTTTLRSSDNVTIKIKENPYVIDSNTLACWHFNGDATDVVNNNIISLKDTVAATTTGWYKFESGAYVQYNRHYGDLGSSYQPFSAPFTLFKDWTIDFWTRVNANHKIGFAYRNNSGSTTSILQFSGSGSTASNNNYFKNNNVDTQLEGLPTDTLCHVAITVDSHGVLSQYINGERVLTVDLSNSLTSFTITGLTSGGTSTGTTSIDELRISSICRWEGLDRFDLPEAQYETSAAADYYVVEAVVDKSLSASSKNPVQNKVINTALSGKQDTLTAGAGITITGNTIAVAMPTTTFYSAVNWTISADNTTLTIPDTTGAALIEVFKNGILMEPTADYTISGTTLTFVSALVPSDDKVAVKVYR